MPGLSKPGIVVAVEPRLDRMIPVGDKKTVDTEVDRYKTDVGLWHKRLARRRG